MQKNKANKMKEKTNSVQSINAKNETKQQTCVTKRLRQRKQN